MAEITIDMARRAKDRVRTIAGSLVGVTGIGLTRVGGSYAVKVNLRGSGTPDLPSQVEGVPIVCEQTGSVTAR